MTGEWNPRDPDPWLALLLDRSLPLKPQVKADFVGNMRSRSRQYVLPFVRPLARLAIVIIQVAKLLMPNRLTSSRMLHWSIARGLAWFVRPDANRLVLRHFHIGSEILRFIADNSGVVIETKPLRPRTLRALEDDVFLEHDLNLYNFIIGLNAALEHAGRTLATVPTSALDFSAITDGAEALAPMPNRWCNKIDIATAIEIYTPLYQLLLTDRDFWRATNSLQLDETIALYVTTILGDATKLALVANRAPLVPESTLRAGHRLLLHGLGTEVLHAMLCEKKVAELSRRAQRAPHPAP